MRARVDTARVEPGQIVELAAAKALLPRTKPQALTSNAPLQPISASHHRTGQMTHHPPGSSSAARGA